MITYLEQDIIYWQIHKILRCNLRYNTRDPISKLYYYWLEDIVSHELEAIKDEFMYKTHGGIDYYRINGYRYTQDQYQELKALLIKRVRGIMNDMIPKLQGFVWSEI